MSIIRCDGCDRMVDTDFYPAAYDEDLDKWWCEACREERDEYDDDLV